MKLPATLLKSLALTVGSFGVVGCNVNLSEPVNEPSPTPAPGSKPTSGLEQAPAPRPVGWQPEGCCETDAPDEVLLVPNPKPKKEPRFCPACGRG